MDKAPRNTQKNLNPMQINACMLSVGTCNPDHLSDTKTTENLNPQN